VGAPTLPQDVTRIVDLQRVSTWSVDNDEWSNVAGGCLHTVKIEARVQYTLHSGDHHGKIVGQTAGHYGIGGDSFDCGDPIERRDDTQNIILVQPAGSNH